MSMPSCPVTALSASCVRGQAEGGVRGIEAEEQVSTGIGDPHVERRADERVARQEADLPEQRVEAAGGEEEPLLAEEVGLAGCAGTTGGDDRVEVGAGIGADIEETDEARRRPNRWRRRERR